MKKMIFLIGILFFYFSCKKDELKVTKEKLLGSWKEVNPCPVGCDTIKISTSEFTSQKHNSIKYQYKVVSLDSIEINRGGYKTRNKLFFAQSNKSLKIEQYYEPACFGCDGADIELIKM